MAGAGGKPGAKSLAQGGRVVKQAVGEPGNRDGFHAGPTPGPFAHVRLTSPTLGCTFFHPTTE